ncbi:phosphoprotein phosphatase, partial [Trifolium medium]|nr:phosphoprotein phosphatase [Trifolium medium]
MCIANCKSLKEIVAKEGDEYNYENEEDDGDDELGDGDEGEFKDGDDNEHESETEDGDGDTSEDESEDEVGGEGEEESVDEDEARIIFKQLKILKLGLLPKLGSFYSGSSTLKFPSLEQMVFTQCHNMKIFRLGDKVSKDL